MGGLDGLLDKLRNGTFGEVIDRLQLALREERVDDHLCPLPKVVVVGSEGVGKSSLLENLTKLQLFPTGEGLKTTCPVVLDLYPARADGDPEYTVSKVGASLFPTKNVEEAMGHVQMYMPCGIIAATPVNVTVTAVWHAPIMSMTGSAPALDDQRATKVAGPSTHGRNWTRLSWLTLCACRNG